MGKVMHRRLCPGRRRKAGECVFSEVGICRGWGESAGSRGEQAWDLKVKALDQWEHVDLECKARLLKPESDWGQRFLLWGEVEAHSH